MEVLRAKSLTKRYIFKKALDDFNLILEKGKIYGLLGPNGSGKTTFMKIAAGLHQASSGEIEVFGGKIGKDSKAKVVYMATSDYLPNWMRIKDTIGYYRDFFEDFDVKEANELVNYMGLEEKMKVKSLSTGMLQRLKIALSLSRNASMYILDEPFNGIDPISREKITKTILEKFDQEKTMLISSHLVNEMETLLDDVIFLDKGKVVLEGNADELRTERGVSIDRLYMEVYNYA